MAGLLAAQETREVDFKKEGLYKTRVNTAWTKRVLQGNSSMKVWMDNEAKLGSQAAPDPLRDIGLDYPYGARNEHVFGGGPVIGGKVNGVRRVSPAYWEGILKFSPSLKDSAREKMWQTYASLDTSSDPNLFGYYKKFMGRKGFDDDHDGKIDEDELDGLDNDGDWNASTDDLGADGLPDSLETGCHGGYDPVHNPDPAFDNYSSSGIDLCHLDANGAYRRMNDKNLYTQNNGIPDHGEQHVDEDFAAVSDHDLYFTSRDTTESASAPLGVKLWAKSYAFEDTAYAAILPFDYYFINTSRNPITGVYLGWVGDLDLGPTSTPDYVIHDYVASLPEYHSIYMHNSIDRGATPLAITILGASVPLDSLTFVYQWWQGGLDFTPQTDTLMYGWMNCEAFGGNCRKPDQPSSTTADMRLFISFGPFHDMAPGDTVALHLALVSGSGIANGPTPMIDNIKKAISFFGSGFHRPVAPISPCLQITPGFKKATLQWGRAVPCANGKPGVDPMSVWDDSNHVANALPPDHWRRVNPPEGHTTGGRIFEGYRLYRSEDPAGSPTSFTLLKEFDVIDQFGFNIGVDTMFVDSNLVRGKRYWYSVTSTGIPDVTLYPRLVTPGQYTVDSIYSPPTESPIGSNMASLDLAFSSSQKLGEVLVVPNPYRVDRDYTLESGGWEGRARDWTESSRVLKFIHLPQRCTIRVFTLAGDHVTTIEHDDPYRGEEEWNILSESNRALASGVYLFTVESDLGRQVGKFVLIR
jgi:hypothetical protein